MSTTARKKGRRPSGDGSVYKSPDGRWRGTVDLGWADGNRRRKYVSALCQSVRRRKAARGEDGKSPASLGPHVELSELKTRHSRRVLYLTPGIVDSLNAHAARQRAERAAVGSLWSDHGLIFPSTVGTPIDPDNFAKQFVRLCKTAGLGHWHPHEARHSAASVMLAQGVPPPSGWRRHSAGRGAILAF